MMAPMFVRTASARDLDAVRALLAETWHATCEASHEAGRARAVTDDWHSTASLKAWLERLDSEFLVADDGERLGGVAYATAADGGRTIVLHQLCVRPDCQGRGLGAMLLDEIEESFHEAQRMRLEVEEANARAIDFCRAQGFARVGRAADGGDGPTDMPALVFEKPVVPAA